MDLYATFERELTMNLSPSSYDAFWRSPERYRLSRIVQPAEKAAPLRQGGAFHAAIEARRLGWEPSRVAAMLRGAPAPSGEVLTLTEGEAQAVGAWVDAWAAQPPLGEVVAVEAWYSVPLTTLDSDAHVLYGRVDAIVRDALGLLWVHEIKTDKAASADVLERAALTEWPRKMQLRAEVLGARALGHQVSGVLLELVGKGGAHPCVRVPIRYMDAELDAARLDFLATARMITLLETTFPDGPWPHPAQQWPCSRLGACEYESVCGCAGAPEPDNMAWVAASRPTLPDAFKV